MSKEQNNRGRQLAFAFGQAYQNILRSPFMSALVLGTMLISLFILGFLLLTINDIQFASSQLNHQLKIVAFLKEDASLDKAVIDVEELPGIITPITKISKDEAQKMMFGSESDKKEMAGLKELFEQDNPFPDSLVIEVENLNQLADIGEAVKKLDAVEEVQYNQNLAEQLDQIRDAVNLFGFTIAGVLLVASLANIINTIQLAVYHRKREIEIMHLVGAPTWFIRLPFILEGIALGILSGILSAGLLILWRVFPLMQLKKVFPFLPFNPSFQPLAMILAVVLLMGVVVGTVGSFLAVHRHLKIKVN